MNYGGIFDFESKESILAKLRKESIASDFWNDSNKASSTLKKISLIEKELELWQDFERRHGDLEVLFEFAESDEASESDIVVELSEYETAIANVELKLKLSGELDASNAILTIHPGAGGTESQDWADMLYRLYSRWIERKNFEKRIIDYQPGDEAGIKDITMEVHGDYAYGLLKAEAGVHRLVRISPFDANSRGIHHLRQYLSIHFRMMKSKSI